VKRTSNESTSQEQPDIQNLIGHFLSFINGIKLYVWPTFRVPTAGSVIPLMNTSFLFESHKMTAEQSEANLLVGLSLISGRKFI